jgi:hypothetical protein
MHEAASHETRLPLTHLADRLNLGAVLISAAGAAYFLALDRVLVSSAHFSPIFRYLLTAHDARTAWLGLAICVLAALWNRPEPMVKVVDFFAKHVLATALASVALLGIGALVVYRDYPFSMDEYTAVFQAKIFASGRMYAQLPPQLIDWLVVKGFNGEFLVGSAETGRIIGLYWPGFALLLAPFEYLNVPWLCNACLAGISIYLIHWITREITGERRAAGWAVLFTIASGAFTADALSYYSMQAHLTANLLFVALLLKPTPWRTAGAGLVGSLALILHNPFPHALFAAPWIIAHALERERRRFLAPLLLGYLPGVAAAVAWLMFRADIASDVRGASVLSGAAGGVFTWPDGLVLNMRAAALVKLWLWGPPGLFLLALLGSVRARGNRDVRLLAQSAVLTFTAYLFVRFDQGHGWGYRYFHSAWGTIPILGACALTAQTRVRPRLVAFAGAAAILNLAIVLPFQLHQINAIIGEHLAQLPPPRRPGNNVYFIHPRGGFYVADMVQIDPLLRDRDLLLVSRGAELDAGLIRQNWPGALEIAAGGAADQWYLGPDDKRVSIPGSRDQWQFVVNPYPPSAAGR